MSAVVCHLMWSLWTEAKFCWMLLFENWIVCEWSCLCELNVITTAVWKPTLNCLWTRVLRYLCSRSWIRISTEWSPEVVDEENDEKGENWRKANSWRVEDKLNGLGLERCGSSFWGRYCKDRHSSVVWGLYKVEIEEYRMTSEMTKLWSVFRNVIWEHC